MLTFLAYIFAYNILDYNDVTTEYRIATPRIAFITQPLFYYSVLSNLHEVYSYTFEWLFQKQVHALAH